MEKQILEIIATDRIDIPISSMSGKLKRAKPKIARDLEIDDAYEGDRAYIRVEETDKMKARGMKDGVAKFSEEFPRYGKILEGYIEEQRALSEIHLYFGMNKGCRLTADDYHGVTQDLGFTQAQSNALYQPIIDASRKISRARAEERSVMIGSKTF